ncbi:putative AAR2 protein [Rosellinia necatrix]|uniref:Putative AAR2 protein n=1 Tax=Rosellinia necatrix TaxID=77044 RepID=A0A1W2TLY3_ROSNE|nr:putative AAR2 protein [Rosellinia necatrix]
MEDSPFPSHGDVFVLDDLPANFTVGCDGTSFNSALPFTGFRDIPFGAHLIWVAPSESASSRSGYWICTPERDDAQPGHVYVKNWDKFNEVLCDPADKVEMRFQTEILERKLPSLSPYRLRAANAESSHNLVLSQDDGDHPDLLGDENIWYQLTSAIRPELLSRITGQTQNTWHVTTTDSVVGDTGLTKEARLYASETPRLRFIFPMNARLINPQAMGQERTRQALDPTGWVLDKLESPNGHYRPGDLTGEFQFTFLVGMHLGNFSCLEQWFFLATQLIFRSYNLTVDRPQQARSLIQTFHAQLLYNDRYLQGDVFELMPEFAHKLRLALTTYKIRLDEKLSVLGDQCTPDHHAVNLTFSSLESWLLRYGWDLTGEYIRSGNVMLEDGEMVQAELSDFEDEDERGEFAPTVVEIENGRESGLLSWDA